MEGCYRTSRSGSSTQNHDRLYIQEYDFDRTIAINTRGPRTTEFDLSEERAMELFQSGRAAAEEFLGDRQPNDRVVQYQDPGAQ